MEIVGKLVKCDACKNNVFVPLIEREEWGAAYAGLPDGWINIKCKMLCPECSAKIREVQREYIETERALYKEKEEKIDKLLEEL